MLEKLYRKQEAPREELPLYVLQNAYNELVERRRELELAEEELLQEIMYRLHQGDAPMDEVAE